MGPRGDDRSGGFTLLEVLVAFVIAALALGALTQQAGGSLQSTRVAGHVEEAVARARAHLVAAGIAPVAGQTQGNDGSGYTWRVSIRPVATATLVAEAAGAPPRARPTLFAMRVDLSWSGDGAPRQVTLETQQIGLLAPAPP